MSKPFLEFQKFLISKQATFSEYEKKLVNLILENFSAISMSGSAAGNRGKLIAKLIDKNGDNASDIINMTINDSADGPEKIVQLLNITVKNFRGFSSEQKFDFVNPYTFVYGPNGTGKSSLCEALEYSLLGSINEADAKRIDTTSYIRNAITKKSDQPRLVGKTAAGNIIPVKSEQSSYEFCFIEKNRIDGFSRVSANTPQAQQTRLAALFGLEEFNLFATQFNENFDRYLDCVGKKAKELADKGKVISGQQAIVSQAPQKETEIKEKERVVLLQFHGVSTIQEAKVFIQGADGISGVVKKNSDEIGRLTNLRVATDPEIDVIISETKDLVALLDERRAARHFLSAYKDQLSLRDLYAAIAKNEAKFPNSCPACESQLYSGGDLNVPVDPYKNATEKLSEFDVAIKKETRIAQISELVPDRWAALRVKLGKLFAVATLVDFEGVALMEQLGQSAEEAKTAQELENLLISVQEHDESLMLLKRHITEFNLIIGKAKSDIEKLKTENLTLAKHLETIISIEAVRKENLVSLDTATLEIKKFSAENSKLIEQVEQEKSIIYRNAKYLVAYESFRQKLLGYNNALPLTLAADLNERTLKFYNLINRHDHISDRLKTLALPTATGKRIEIEFESGEKCDALHILSEGHIRCLGLAILLSKIVRDDLPFLIFDDVVNSIDDEHRSGIIELILGDGDIKGRQLIITTHGEDFVKRLENAIPAKDYKNIVNRIDFLTPIDSKTIHVKTDVPRHYLIVAEKSFQEGRTRDCLSYIRKAFEELLNRLWKNLSKKNYSAQIQVGMRSPNGSPDLMSVASGLRGFLAKKEVVVFQDVLPSLEKMLGKEKVHSVEWGYLNKGTHEGDKVEEFDSVVVKDMLAVVVEMDTALGNN
ncbi:AAA family ATPase [Caballeronia sp. LjRoot34]|uniref:AAA family ATPase n=1 Tax=Caballeronia sp. LjRoot34 TaxID=3342325 RepID=UPI003ED0D0F2